MLGLLARPMIINVFATLDGFDQLIKHNTTKIDEAWRFSSCERREVSF